MNRIEGSAEQADVHGCRLGLLSGRTTHSQYFLVSRFRPVFCKFFRRLDKMRRLSGDCCRGCLAKLPANYRPANVLVNSRNSRHPIQGIKVFSCERSSPFFATAIFPRLGPQSSDTASPSSALFSP